MDAEPTASAGPNLRGLVNDPAFVALPVDRQRALALQLEPKLGQLDGWGVDRFLTKLADDPYAFTDARHNLQPGTMRAIEDVESLGGKNLTSPTGVRGNFQITRATGHRYGLPDDQWDDPLSQLATAGNIVAGDGLDHYPDPAVKADWLRKVNARIPYFAKGPRATDVTPSAAFDDSAGAPPDPNTATTTTPVTAPRPTGSVTTTDDPRLLQQQLDANAAADAQSKADVGRVLRGGAELTAGTLMPGGLFAKTVASALAGALTNATGGLRLGKRQGVNGATRDEDMSYSGNVVPRLLSGGAEGAMQELGGRALNGLVRTLRLLGQPAVAKTLGTVAVTSGLAASGHPVLAGMTGHRLPGILAEAALGRGPVGEAVAGTALSPPGQFLTRTLAASGPLLEPARRLRRRSP